jgi:membrane peptidoglycan carboxypeptidase
MDDICVDEPITIEFNNTLWSPGNYNHTFKGPVTRAFGFYRSLNTVAVQTLYTAGIQNTVNAARACGITQGVQPYPSLALGCIDASPLQAVSLFNCFAHQGVFTEPYYIEWIKDKQGTKIYKHKESSTQVFNWQATSQVAATLCAGMSQLRKRSPAGSSLHALGAIPLMGKTGTTNDARSCFFVGATPRYTAAAYIGNDENRAMGNDIFASQTVLPLVIDILKQTPCRADEHFMYHPDLQPVTIHEITGLAVKDLHDPHAIEILVPREKKAKQ